MALPLILSGMGRAEAQDQVAEPLVVFADEPTGALDSTTSEQVLTALLDSITRPPPTADPAWCECRTAGSWPAPTAAPAAPPSPPGAPCELRRNPSRPPPVPGPAVQDRLVWLLPVTAYAVVGALALTVSAGARSSS